MKAILSTVMAGLLVAMIGCGGGGGGGGNDCSDLAKKFSSCPDGPSYAEVKDGCDALVCAGKQAAIDCMMALSCSETTESEADACLTSHDCPVP
jgi:hypothetical protein